MRKIVILILPLLTGCGLVAQQKMQAASNFAKQEMLQCKADYESHAIKTCVEMAKCSNAAADKFAASGYPYPDLIEYSKATRTSLCQKVDKGKMSFDDANLEMTKTGIEITNEEQRRIAVNSNMSANQTQSNAAMLGASSSMLQAVKPASNGVNCNTSQMGQYGTINCH